MTFSVTPHNTISYTTSTKVIVNTTISSPAMAGIDASSKEAFSSRANNSSPNMISLVIQTTRIESTTLTRAQTSTPLVMLLLPTTTIAIPEKMTSSEKVSSMIEASATMNVFPTNTVISTQEPPTEKQSTNINHSTSTITAVVKPSLNINSQTTTSINVPHVQTSSPYLSTVALPTPPVMSQPTKVSTTLLATSKTSLVKPSKTISGASSSSIQEPAATCQPECKANELCISNSQPAICKAAQNLEGNFRITSGANFTVDLKDKNSKAFTKLAIQIEEVIDSICKHSQYSSVYLGAQVLGFEQGSIIVLYKLSFESTFTLSDDIVEDIAQVFRNAQDINFTIDNSSISIEDFDECFSGLATKCYKTATCNNTLGSYSCICPKGTAGDGFSCQVVNSGKSEDKDINECNIGTDICHENADCIDNDGNYSCQCKIGYSGNGFACSIVLLTLGFSNPSRMTAAEGSNVVLTIEVTGQITTQIFATATVSPASASDADFNVLSSTELNFRPGVTKDTIVIATKDDSITEVDEVFVVTLSTTNPSVQIDKTKGVTTVTIHDNDALNPSPTSVTSSSKSNNWVLIGAAAAAVVVIVTSILIAVCCFHRRNRRSRENTRDVVKIENPAFEGCRQPSRHPPQLPDSEIRCEQPALYAQLNSSARVTIDEHYQSLHLDEDCYERVDF